MPATYASAYAPRVVGRYAMYDVLSEGGMGTVRLARLLGPIGFSRTVVIKQLRSELGDDPELAGMLIDEARIASRIQHPNVVSTLDAVVVGRELFLVMEYVVGESLSQALGTTEARDLRVPIPIVVAIALGVLHGLHAAHEATDDQGANLEVVHRDVSPHNILIGVDGHPRVLDFGIAKAIGRVRQTQPGQQLMGKAHYMAPEQWTRGHVTRKADIYAAGLVLWQMIAGRSPFLDPDPLRVLAGVSEPPSSYHYKGGETVRDDVMAQLTALDAITMRALALDPAKRFETAREMALALEALGPATASAVGEWITSLAKEALLERAQRVRNIERQSSRAPALAASEARDEPPPTLEAARSSAFGGLTKGDIAPEIDAVATTGERFILSRSSKPYTVVYFFPKAFTPGCTREAGLFRENFAELALAGARVVGISTDDHETQCAFAQATKAPFPMIADADLSISRAFGVLWPLIHVPKRITFVIARPRRIVAVFRHELSMVRHRDDVLRCLDDLRRTDAPR